MLDAVQQQIMTNDYHSKTHELTGYIGNLSQQHILLKINLFVKYEARIGPFLLPQVFCLLLTMVILYKGGN